MPNQLSKPFVDCHFHVFDAGVGRADARYVPAYDASLLAWQSSANAVGVSRGVLVQPSFLGTDNSRLLAELKCQPQTLRGVAVADASWRLPALQPLHDAGVRGIRLNFAGLAQDFPHRFPEWLHASDPWDALTELGWHVEVHTDIGCLPGVLERLPASIPLVIDHMGKPDAVSAKDPTVRAVARRARAASVHVKLSGSYRLGGRNPKALARLWLDELGKHSLLWGSDWPCTNHEELADYPSLLMALWRWLDGEPEAIEAALSVNPLKLYWGAAT